MSIYGWLIRITDRLPEVLPLAHLAKRYADRCYGENTDNADFNGENVTARRLLPNASVVFDVGANIGEWTQYATDLNPNLTVHCFEPIPINWEALARNTQGRKVVVNHVAVGATEEEREMFVFSSTGCSSMHQRTLAGRGDGTVSERVKVTTLDAYCRDAGIEHVDFVKIDVEGHELAVLKGMTGLLSAKRVEAIQFEYGGTYIDSGARLRDVFALLSSHDYELHKLYSSGPRKVAAFHPDMENFQFQNWLAVKKGSKLLG